jgi:hypothetical protein
MGEYIFVFSMLFVFLWRDVQLLATQGDFPLSRRLVLYGVVQFTSLAGFRFLLGPIADRHFIHLLRFPVVWMASMVLHGAAWLLCIAMQRTAPQRNAWLVALTPSPVLVLSLLYASTEIGMGEQGLRACLLMTVLWMAAVSVAAIPANAADRDASSFAIEFAGFSSATMLAAIPVMLLAF